MHARLWEIVLAYVVVPDKILVDWVDLKELNVDDIPTGPEFDRLRFQRTSMRSQFDDALVFDVMCSKIVGTFTQLTRSRWQKYITLSSSRGQDDALAGNASRFALDMIRCCPRLLDNGNIFRNPHVELFMSRKDVLEKCCNDVSSMFHLSANPNPTIMTHCILHANGIILSHYHMIRWCARLHNVYWKRRVARKILSICMERSEPTPVIEIEHLEYFESDPDIRNILDEPQFSTISRKLTHDPDNIDWEALCENPSAYRPGGIIETELGRDPVGTNLDWHRISSQPAAMRIITKYPDMVEFEGLVRNPAAIAVIKEQWPFRRGLQRYRIGLNPAIYLDDVTTIPSLALCFHRI